jgi:hypothetical protein
LTNDTDSAGEQADRLSVPTTLWIREELLVLFPCASYGPHQSRRTRPRRGNGLKAQTGVAVLALGTHDRTRRYRHRLLDAIRCRKYDSTLGVQSPTRLVSQALQETWIEAVFEPIHLALELGESLGKNLQEHPPRIFRSTLAPPWNLSTDAIPKIGKDALGGSVG